MMKRNDLPALFAARGYRAAAEIGVLRGEFSDVILSGWGGTLLMVDAWRHLPDYVDQSNGSDEHHFEAYKAAAAVAKKHAPRGKIMWTTSLEAAAAIPNWSLDAVYIDANHAYEAVLADLAAWLPKVRSGGLIAGHDYLDGVRPEGVFGVKRAVDEFFGGPPAIVTDEPWPTWIVDVKEQSDASLQRREKAGDDQSQRGEEHQPVGEGRV